MKLRRALAIMKGIFIRLGHDRRTFGMIVIMPILFIVLFGYAFAGSPEDVSVIIVNEDKGFAILPTVEPGNLTVPLNLSEAVISKFDRVILDISYSKSLEEARQKVEEGNAWAVIHFSRNFSQDMLSKILYVAQEGEFNFSGKGWHIQLENLTFEEAHVDLDIDSSNVQVSQAITQEVSSALMAVLQQEEPQSSLSDFLNIQHVYGKNAKFIDFFAPGIICLVVTIITLILTIVSFVRERTQGTLARLYVSPTEESEIILGYTIAFAAIAAFQSAELLLLAVYLFHIIVLGSILLALSVIILYAVGLLGLGFLLSNLAKNEFQAIQFVPLVFLPSILLAGVLWPIESMPAYVRPLSNVIPLTYAARALRSVMIRGWSAGDIWLELLALIIFAGLMFFSSILVMKKKSYQG